MEIKEESNGKTTEFKKIIKCIEIAEKNNEISKIEGENLIFFLEEVNNTIKTIQYMVN